MQEASNTKKFFSSIFENFNGYLTVVPSTKDLVITKREESAANQRLFYSLLLFRAQGPVSERIVSRIESKLLRRCGTQNFVDGP